MSCTVIVRRLSQFIESIDNPLIIMGLCALVCSAAMLFAGVILRYLFHATIPLFEELSVNLVIWAVMIFSGPVFKRGSHVGMEFVAGKLKGRARAIHQLILDLVIFGICFLLFWKGIELVKISHLLGKTTNSGALSVWYMQMAIPVGGLIYGVYVISEFIKLICVLIKPELTDQVLTPRLEESSADGTF